MSSRCCWCFMLGEGLCIGLLLCFFFWFFLGMLGLALERGRWSCAVHVQMRKYMQRRGLSDDSVYCMRCTYKGTQHINLLCIQAWS
jgi:hypothetical protein